MPDVYEEDAMYKVKFSRVVKLGNAELRPLHEHGINGRALKQIVDAEGSDAIESAELQG